MGRAACFRSRSLSLCGRGCDVALLVPLPSSSRGSRRCSLVWELVAQSKITPYRYSRGNLSTRREIISFWDYICGSVNRLGIVQLVYLFLYAIPADLSQVLSLLTVATLGWDGPRRLQKWTEGQHFCFFALRARLLKKMCRIHVTIENVVEAITRF